MVTDNRCTQSQGSPTWDNKFVQMSWPRPTVGKAHGMILRSPGRPGLASELLTSAEHSRLSEGQGPESPLPEQGRAPRPGAL